MKKLVLLLSGTLLFLLGSSFNASVPENNSVGKIDITLSDSVMHGVNPLLYGFSCNNLYTEIAHPDDTAFLKAIKQLSPKVLRWPGGNSSNYVHALENGYGYVKSQVQNADIRTSIQMDRQGLFQLQEKANHPYLLDFIRLVKLCDAKVLLVANIVTGTPESCIEQIKFFKENGIEVAGVELGSELFLPNIRSIFPFPGSYIVKASEFTAALRKGFPDIKIGACAAPYNKIGDDASNYADQTFFKSWNDAISRETVFDAVSINYYLPVTVKSGISVDSSFEIAVKDLTRLYSLGGLVPVSMEYYSRTFSKSKIWFTEWNIAARQTQNYYFNTLYQAIYIQLFLHFINTYNAVHDNQIELATFASLATGGRSAGNGVITLREEKENLQGTFIKRAAYYGFDNIRDVFQQQNFLIEATASVTDQIQFYAYYDTSGKNISIYWNNYSGKEYAPGNLIAGKDTLPIDLSVTVNCFYGSLSAGYGFLKFLRVNSNVPPEQQKKEMPLSEVKFYANSFGYMRLKADSALLKQLR